MSRQPNGSGRYYVTLEKADADRLEAAARDQGRPPTTEAARRIVQTLRSDAAGAPDALAAALGELAEVRHELELARAANTAVRRRLSQSEDGDGPEVPRWEWPLEDLLADRDWWHTWLPRLYQLVGRPSRAYTREGENTVDDWGYLDLMASLFPPASDGGGQIEWDSADYPERVRRQSANRPLLHGVDRADIWEPVIRHVAVALCSLELTAAPGAMPMLRIRTEEELTGPWLQTLRRLTGAEPAQLPGPPA